jgi:hypothetical protein
MNRLRVTLLLIPVLLAAACTSKQEGPDAEAPRAESTSAQPLPDAVPASVPAFVNKVWRVTESKQVSPGDLRIFLSDGTLVMASDNAKPALGRWSDAAGRLTITEDGIDYPTDILDSTADTLRIRMLSPGEPVEMRLTRAQGGVPVTPPAALAFAGTVRHLDLEGGQFVIETQEGTRYQPIDLPQTFRRDGLRVEVQAIRREDTMSIGMTGPMIELRQIREHK